jgi:hypothetical protein
MAKYGKRKKCEPQEKVKAFKLTVKESAKKHRKKDKVKLIPALIKTPKSSSATGRGPGSSRKKKSILTSSRSIDDPETWNATGGWGEVEYDLFVPFNISNTNRGTNVSFPIVWAMVDTLTFLITYPVAK